MATRGLIRMLAGGLVCLHQLAQDTQDLLFCALGALIYAWGGLAHLAHEREIARGSRG